ncbi:xanthine dehydrogenase family protein subunit M [Nocardioidaceae bacterium]|nr:xanthine dehydrogenase family protein subunit M [Nocardioidaceae bacterium]
MIPAPFDYAAPTSVADALSLLREHGDEAKILAGGQSLIPVLRLRLNAPSMVVDLGKIDTLRSITDDGDTITIGSMAPYADVLASELVAEHAAVLRHAVAEVADPQIRRRGTVGGALVHADPAGDVGAPAMCLDAEMLITGAGGDRSVSIHDFFEGFFTTAVGEDEILTGIRIPKLTGWGATYEKFVRVQHQWSICAVAATVKMDGDQIAEARIGLTNMGQTPMRATAVEEALVGGDVSPERVARAAAKAAEGTDPPSDLNGDADYRRHLATVLTRRAVLAAAG